MADFTTLQSGIQRLTATPTGEAGQVLNSNFILADAHITSTANPHQTTAAQVGAYSTSQIDSTVATLNAAIAAANALISSLQSSKANVAPTPTAGHLAALDGSGNVTDSGYGPSSFDAANAAATVSAAVHTSITTHTAGTGTTVHGATASNTPGQIVCRDGSGNFSAGTITANLTGTASNATTASTLSGSITTTQVTGLTTALAAKADKIIPATVGSFATLNNTGDLTDSGYTSDSFFAADAGGSLTSSITALSTQVNGVYNSISAIQTGTYSTFNLNGSYVTDNIDNNQHTFVQVADNSGIAEVQLGINDLPDSTREVVTAIYSGDPVPALILNNNGLTISLGSGWTLLPGYATETDFISLSNEVSSLSGSISGSGSSISNVYSPLSLNTGTLSISQSNGFTSGYLSSSDWNTFNSAAGSISSLGTEVSNLSSSLSSLSTISTANTPLSLSGGTLSISQANSSTSGYLSSSDWNTFNGLSGSVSNLSSSLSSFGSSLSSVVTQASYPLQITSGTVSANGTSTTITFNDQFGSYHSLQFQNGILTSGY